MHHRFVVCRRNFDGRVLGTGGRATDQQRHIPAFFLHRSRNDNHLLQRRRDQAAQTDDVRITLLRFRQNRFARHHHTQVDHSEIVAAQHDGDNVLSNVVNVSFDRGDQEGPPCTVFLRPVGKLSGCFHNGHGFLTGLGEQPVLVEQAAVLSERLFGFHEWFQPRNRLLHHSRRLHHLRQEHLARTEEFSNNIHAIHQRPLNHIQGTTVFLTSFFGVFVNKVRNTLQQSVAQPLFNRTLPPFECLRRPTGLLLNGFRVFDQTFRGIRPTVQQDIFDVHQQVGVDFVIDLQLRGIDDAHVQTGFDRVIQEGRIHRFPHDVVATEAKTDVADTA